MKRITWAGSIPVKSVVPQPDSTAWKGHTIAATLNRAEAFELITALGKAMLDPHTASVTLTVFRDKEPLRLTVTTP